MSNYYKYKTILITGAASGIGKRFAEKIAQQQGVTLVLWDIDSDGLHQLQQTLTQPKKVIIEHVDLSDLDSVKKHSGQLIRQGVYPDFIINCAGIVVGKMFHDHTTEEINDTIAININGSMQVVRPFLEKMIERGSGHIVNLASASGYIGNPRMSVYAASKWAILGWTESLRLEMEKLETGVFVTAVIPSYIKTGMFKGVKPPLLVPLLETDRIVDLMIKDIAKQKYKIQAPFLVRFVPFLKTLLPVRLFDWIAGNLLGVYGSMDSFTGRNKK